MNQMIMAHAPAQAASQRIGLDHAFDLAFSTNDGLAEAATGVLVALAEVGDWRAWTREAWSLLDGPERTRVERRRMPADREQLTLAYALHRLLLARLLDRDPCEVPLHRDPQGCPRVEGTSIGTSLSHSDGCIAIAVSRSGAVGVDIEPATRASVMAEIADQVCHPVDGAALAADFGAAWRARLLRLWVRKEAFLKAAGVGLERDMRSFAAPDGAVLALAPGRADTAQLRMLDLGPDWVGALAGPAHLDITTTWLRPGH